MSVSLSHRVAAVLELQEILLVEENETQPGRRCHEKLSDHFGRGSSSSLHIQTDECTYTRLELHVFCLGTSVILHVSYLTVS